MNTHEQLVDAQFGPRAQAYVASAVHAQGEDLAEIVAAAAALRPSRILDLGCGGGHVAFGVAPHAREVTAYDLSEEMLAAVARTAAERQLQNITVVHGAAEQLPFADETFDLVLTRFSAHHWGDVRAGLREARRVLKRSGKAIFADVVAPESAGLDTFVQTIEYLRDPSHVRDYSALQWREYLAGAGFTVTGATSRKLRLDFAAWIERMQTPPERTAAIRSLQHVAAEEIRRYFVIEPDGTFTIDTLALQADPAVR